MNEKREILLLKAMKNNGRINVKTANRLYSGNGGKDALISLEFQGYLENAGFGNFKINTDKEFPQSVVQRFKTYQDSKDDSSEKTKYVSEQVKSVEAP